MGFVLPVGLSLPELELLSVLILTRFPLNLWAPIPGNLFSIYELDYLSCGHYSALFWMYTHGSDHLGF